MTDEDEEKSTYGFFGFEYIDRLYNHGHGGGSGTDRIGGAGDKFGYHHVESAGSGKRLFYSYGMHQRMVYFKTIIFSLTAILSGLQRLTIDKVPHYNVTSSRKAIKIQYIVEKYGSKR